MISEILDSFCSSDRKAQTTSCIDSNSYHHMKLNSAAVVPAGIY